MKSLAIDPKIKEKELTSSGLKAFFRITEDWELTRKEQAILLGCGESTLYTWKNNPSISLSPEKLERISYILGIYKALQILFPNPKHADQWIKKPNNAPLFGGKSALDRMLSGLVSDLYVVRQYLDSERGGW